MRFRTFLKYVFKPKFGITDYWSRYEFQGRGSTHVHGFAWLDPGGAPEVQAAPLNEVSRQEFTQFWSKHVFAVNPEPNRQPPARRSRSVYNSSTAQLANTFGQLSDVVNRTQKHACSEAYCLRKRKKAEIDAPDDLPRQCRFYFPRATGPASTNKVRVISVLSCLNRFETKLANPIPVQKPEVLHLLCGLERFDVEPIQPYRCAWVAG